MQVIESIWNEYHNKLHRFIQGRVSDASIADDILQEVIIRVHSRINTLKDINKIQNWLYRIARNAIIDHYRAQKQMQELPETLTHPKQDTDDKARQEIALKQDRKLLLVFCPLFKVCLSITARHLRCQKLKD
jgi:RNA polymerase sigma-70 factor (ECF subfamily)